MALPQFQTKQYSIDILTADYLFHGFVEPIGMLMTYLDSPERANILLKQVTATGLGSDSAVQSIKIKELWVRRSDITAIMVNEADLEGAVQNLPAQEKLRVFLPRFVVQGIFTHGEDTRVGDMFEVLKGTWASAHNNLVLPLTSLRSQIFREAPFLLINKQHIRFYEPFSG